MIDLSGGHMLLVALVALIVIGPKDLPKAMRFVGQWVGRGRAMVRHFRSGFDEMVRQAELDEMEKRWAAENARIMREHPLPPPEEMDDGAAAQGSSPGGAVMEPLTHGATEGGATEPQPSSIPAAEPDRARP